MSSSNPPTLAPSAREAPSPLIPCTPPLQPARPGPAQSITTAHHHTHSPSSGSCCRLSALCRACCSSRASISRFFCAISSSCWRIFAVVLADLDCATPNHRLAFPEGGKEGGRGRDYRPLQREGPPERGAPAQAERPRSAALSRPGRRGEGDGRGGEAVPGASRWWWWWWWSILELLSHHAPRWARAERCATALPQRPLGAVVPEEARASGREGKEGAKRFAEVGLRPPRSFPSP